MGRIKIEHSHKKRGYSNIQNCCSPLFLFYSDLHSFFLCIQEVICIANLDCIRGSGEDISDVLPRFQSSHAIPNAPRQNAVIVPGEDLLNIAFPNDSAQAIAHAGSIPQNKEFLIHGNVLSPRIPDRSGLFGLNLKAVLLHLSQISLSGDFCFFKRGVEGFRSA